MAASGSAPGRPFFLRSSPDVATSIRCALLVTQSYVLDPEVTLSSHVTKLAHIIFCSDPAWHVRKVPGVVGPSEFEQSQAMNDASASI